MKVEWISRSGARYIATLGGADYIVADLQTMKKYEMLFQFIFSEKGSPWLERNFWLAWMEGFRFAMEMEKGVIGYKYGYENEFSGGEGVAINGEVYNFDFGVGECCLSQDEAYSKSLGPGISESGSRLTKWIDLRGQKELITDDRVIKIARKKITLRWSEEVANVIEFLYGLAEDDEVRSQRSFPGRAR